MYWTFRTYNIGGIMYHRTFWNGMRHIAHYFLPNLKWYIGHLFKASPYTGVTSRGVFFDAIRKPFSKKLIITKAYYSTKG